MKISIFCHHYFKESGFSCRECFMPFFFTVQTNKPFVLVIIKNCKYPVKLKNVSLVLSPSLWNLKLNKRVIFYEKFFLGFFWFSSIYPPPFNWPFLNHRSWRDLYLPSFIMNPDSLFPSSNHFGSVRVRERTYTTPVDCIKKAVLGSALLNIREEVLSLSHDYFSKTIMSSDDQAFLGLLLLICK